MKAKRIAKRKPSSSNSPNKGQNVDTSRTRPDLSTDETSIPNKRPRLEPRMRREHDEPGHRSKVAGPSRPPQIISSLFSYNPKVDVEYAPKRRETKEDPSNAPLTDRSSFIGLGLDPLIVSHLGSKMDISTPTAIQREALPPLLSSDVEDTHDRDVFIQSQTGSGKTLSFLLPILQDLLPLSSLSYIDRSIGTLAIIIAPTRELAKQISDVLETLLQLRLRPQEEGVDGNAARLTRWLVSGLLIGGENRTHEKSRLRKGLPILVSTPGRLLDHLQNTSSFNVGKCRWLVLDEADRLMDLGFEESIKGILQALDGRRKLAVQAIEEGKSHEVGGWDWTRRRRTVLCSATIKENIQHLAGTALIRPIVVKAIEATDSQSTPNGASKAVESPLEEKFTPPSQLSQKYIVAPLKLRLVTLIALLRTLLAQAQSRIGIKIIVFLSCTDSVDFHWQLLGKSSMEDNSAKASAVSDDNDNDDEESAGEEDRPKLGLRSPLLPGTSIYRLHGSLALQTRQASLKEFSASKRKGKEKGGDAPSSILLCTSVAARGLDLPQVRAVIQYDLPTEGGVTEYVHRVGRTARVGKGGEAWSFVSPNEQQWVPWLEERVQEKEKKSRLVPASVDSVLRSGFGGKGAEFEERATQVQLAFERWVVKRKEVNAFSISRGLVLMFVQHGELARKAFQSHMRAYATHPSDEKHIFQIRNLHLGHLAKAFALRDAPGVVSQKGNLSDTKNSKASTKRKIAKGSAILKGRLRHEIEHDTSAERRMQEVVRRQGRLVKKGGVLMTSGTDEFQIGGGYSLDGLAV